MSGRRRSRLTFWRRLLPLLLAGLLFGPASLADPAKERELRELGKRIGKLNVEIQRDLKIRKDTRNNLQRVEREITTARKRLQKVREERETLEADVARLRIEERDLNAALDSDKSRLAREVRTAFVNGRQEHIKLLLNQRDPAEFGRMTVYYRLFTEQRAAQIDRVVKNLEALADTTQQLQKRTEALASVEQKRRAELGVMEASRQERRTLIDQIDAQLRANDSEVKTLQKEQVRLEGLIAELQELLKDYPVATRDAFPKLKGRLAWPLKGRLLADFGQPRAGAQMKWNGVLIRASRGNEVRAIARGRVAYADWLPGLGLLTVVEHSDGYISLYGHNETLTHQAGEWVDAGDVVATAGDSGGQSQTALYFEIRRGRTPVNPHSWFKASVGGR